MKIFYVFSLFLCCVCVATFGGRKVETINSLSFFYVIFIFSGCFSYYIFYKIRWFSVGDFYDLCVKNNLHLYDSKDNFIFKIKYIKFLFFCCCSPAYPIAAELLAVEYVIKYKDDSYTTCATVVNYSDVGDEVSLVTMWSPDFNFTTKYYKAPRNYLERGDKLCMRVRSIPFVSVVDQIKKGAEQMSRRVLGVTH